MVVRIVSCFEFCSIITCEVLIYHSTAASTVEFPSAMASWHPSKSKPSDIKVATRVSTSYKIISSQKDLLAKCEFWLQFVLGFTSQFVSYYLIATGSWHISSESIIPFPQK